MKDMKKIEKEIKDEEILLPLCLNLKISEVFQEDGSGNYRSHPRSFCFFLSGCRA